MNKSDIKLTLGIVIFCISCIILLIIFREKGSKKAIVYYENEAILSIDLNSNLDTSYTVEGFNGAVEIITKDGKVKVKSENSPKHLCSKQGWISQSYETIICLPNKIIIKIESDDDYDAVVG